MTTTGRMSRRFVRAWFVLGGLVMAGPLGARPFAAPAAASVSKAELVECDDSLYRFLPGEVNFCLALHERQRNNAAGTFEMLRLAAGWGNKRAQYVLGVMYFNGDLVAANRPLGLAWLGLAAERGDRVYAAVFASAYGKATTAERQQAQTRYDALLAVYADAVAARRAQRRFDREMHELTSQEPYPSQLCIAGVAVGVVGQEPICPSARLAIAELNRYGDAYFEGWTGRVSVGALESVRTAGDGKSKQMPGDTSQD